MHRFKGDRPVAQLGKEGGQYANFFNRTLHGLAQRQIIDQGPHHAPNLTLRPAVVIDDLGITGTAATQAEEIVAAARTMEGMTQLHVLISFFCSDLPTLAKRGVRVN